MNWKQLLLEAIKYIENAQDDQDMDDDDFKECDNIINFIKDVIGDE